MANITIRNIPDSVLNKIRTLSEIEKRSINNELLILIENGLKDKTESSSSIKNLISKENQISIWKKIIGTWNDGRSTEQIIGDIYSHRTKGRKVNL